MRMIRLLLPILAVVGAVFSRRNKTPSKATAVTPQAQPDFDTLIDNLTTKMDVEASFEDLLAQLDDTMSEEQQAALLSRQEDVVPVLLHVVEDGKSHLREHAVHMLGILGGDVARDAAIAALSDYSLWVRGAAAETLGHIGDPTSVPHLAEALTDSEQCVRECAQSALAQIGGEAANAVLADYVNWKPDPDEPRRRRQRLSSDITFKLVDDYE